MPCWGCPCTAPESILLTDPEVNGTPWRCAQSSPHWNWALKDGSPQKRQGWTLLGENTVSVRAKQRDLWEGANRQAWKGTRGQWARAQAR